MCRRVRNRQSRVPPCQGRQSYLLFGPPLLHGGNSSGIETLWQLAYDNRVLDDRSVVKHGNAPFGEIVVGQRRQNRYWPIYEITAVEQLHHGSC